MENSALRENDHERFPVVLTTSHEHVHLVRPEIKLLSDLSIADWNCEAMKPLERLEPLFSRTTIGTERSGETTGTIGTLPLFTLNFEP